MVHIQTHKRNADKLRSFRYVLSAPRKGWYRRLRYIMESLLPMRAYADWAETLEKIISYEPFSEKRQHLSQQFAESRRSRDEA